MSGSLTDMNDERATGVILRVHALSETSLVVRWLTAEQGRLATVARGARGPKSTFAGKLDLGFAADFSFARSRRSELHALREVVVTEPHAALRGDYARLAQAAYAVALVEQLTETETPVPEAFVLFREFLAYLNAYPAQSRAVFAFELRMLASQGMQPEVSPTDLTAEARDLMNDLVSVPWMKLPVLQASPSAVRSLRQFLHGFLICHCGRLPKGRAEALGR